MPQRSFGIFFEQRRVNRGSYMNAHVLLSLLKELGEKDKMQGLLSILSLFSQQVK